MGYVKETLDDIPFDAFVAIAGGYDEAWNDDEDEWFYVELDNYEAVEGDC